MADETGAFLPPRDGERIPRKIPPQIEDAPDMKAGIFAKKLAVWKVALDDINQFGPHAMIFLLVILAIVTGGFLQLLSLIFG